MIDFFANTELGQEVMDGLVGGSLAGLSQLGSEKSPGQLAIETSMAILGGIGIGAMGRRVGGAIGRRVHEGKLKNQDGMLAMIGRLGGQDTLAQTFTQNAASLREGIKESLIQNTSAKMAREAMADPQGFRARHGITPDQFNQYIDKVQNGRSVAAMLTMMESMPPKTRERLADQIFKEYEMVENAVAKEAHTGVDDFVTKTVAKADEHGKKMDEIAPGYGKYTSGAARHLGDGVQPITGEHVGIAAGRFIGDEIGILGGMFAGSLLAQELGIQSPKDAKIAELQKQLAARQGQ